MTTQIVRRLKDQYKGVIYYVGGLILYLWLIISMFPSVQKMDFNKMIEQMPEYMKGFYTSGGLKDVGTIEGFLSGEILSFFLIFILAFYVAGSASSTIAGAIEKRTLDFTMSQPISRTRYFFSDFIVTIVFASIITGLTLLSIKPICSAYNIDVSGTGLLKLWGMAMMMMLAIYGISLIFTSIMKSKSAVVSITVGLTFAFYMLTTLAAALDKLKDLRPYSLYYYYKPYELMTGQSAELKDIAVLGGVFIVGTALSLLIFNKKDL
jgi:ABC-2 type transport system permease protein